ncbi:hypothetical protein DJ524_09095, partial [Sulfolobus sp. D5]
MITVSSIELILPTFLTIISVILGIFYVVAPSLEPPDRVLGAKVTEEFRKSNKCKQIIKQYRIRGVMIVVISLVLGGVLLFEVSPLVPFPIIILLILGSVNYVTSRKRVILERGEIKEPNVRYAVIDTSKKKGFGVWFLALPWLILLGMLILGVVDYHSIPSELPFHINSNGVIAYAPKDPVNVLLNQIINAFLLFIFTIVGIAVYVSKPRINPAYPEEYYKSYERSKEYAVATIGIIATGLTLLESLLTLWSWGIFPLNSISVVLPLSMVAFLSCAILGIVISLAKMSIEGGRYL